MVKGEGEPALEGEAKAMSEQDEKLLNDYLDDELSDEERKQLEVRLDREASLLREYAALLEVVKATGTLPPEAKLADPQATWARIAERTGAGAGDVTEGASVRSAPGFRNRRPKRASARTAAARRKLPFRRFALTAPRLAAGFLLATLGGAATWLAMGAPGFGPSDDPSQDQTTPGVMTALGGSAALEIDALFDGYERSARIFDRVLKEGADALSPETLEAVREALAVADQAIAEARRALEEDPGSEELARILFASMKRRLEMLRSAASLVQSAA